MSKQMIKSAKLAPPVGPFSPAVRIDGLVYLSGQVGQDPSTGKIVEGGVERETEQIFAGLGSVLEAAGPYLRRRHPRRCLSDRYGLVRCGELNLCAVLSRALPGAHDSCGRRATPGRSRRNRSHRHMLTRTQ